MKHLFTILLLCCFSIEAQTLEGLAQSDSIYFYFPSAKQLDKKKFYINHTTKDTTVMYSYFKNDKVILELRHSKHENFDAQFAGIETYKEYHKKRFLRKNKDKIVTIDFLNNLDNELNKFIGNLGKKKVFIIDEEEIKGRKILVRQVFFNMSGLANDATDEFLIFKTDFTAPFYKKYQFDDNFYTFLLPKIESTLSKEDIYILFEPSDKVAKDSTQYSFRKVDNSTSQKIKEQYTFKLNIKGKVVFFQLTNNRSKDAVLEKKHDLFKNDYETISFEDLNNFSEKQLEELFSRVRNIYIVEDFSNKDYVAPKMVKATSDLVEFVKNND